MGMTLNDVSKRKAEWAAVAVICLSAIAFFVLNLVDSTFAESFIGKSADSLLKDFAKVVALVGIGAGIFQVVKGRTVVGIVIAIVAAILYFFCMNDTALQKIGQSIYGLFF